MKKIKLIQASLPRTGSTLVSNILNGLFTPNEPIQYLGKYRINNKLIIKSHKIMGPQIQ